MAAIISSRSRSGSSVAPTSEVVALAHRRVEVVDVTRVRVPHKLVPRENWRPYLKATIATARVLSERKTGLEPALHALRSLRLRDGVNSTEVEDEHQPEA